MHFNVLSNIMALLLNVAMPLIIIPIITNDLGLNGYGIYAANVALALLISIIADFGLNMYAPRLIASSNSINKTKAYCSFILFLKIAFSVLAGSIYLFVYGSSYNELILTAYIIILVLNPASILSGLELYKEQMLITFISKVVLISLFYASDFSKNGISQAIIIQVFTQFISLLISIFYLRVYLCNPFLSIDKKNMRKILTESFHYYYSKLFVNIYQQSSTYFVSIFLSNDLVAIYSIANQFYRLGLAVIGAISKVLLTNTIKTKNFIMIHKYAILCFVIMLIFYPVVYFYSEFILSFIFDFDTKQLAKPLIYFYGSLFFAMISSFYGYPALASLNKDKYSHIGIIISSISYFICIAIAYIYRVNLLDMIMFILVSDFFAMIFRLACSIKFGVFNVNLRKVIL